MSEATFTRRRLLAGAAGIGAVAAVGLPEANAAARSRSLPPPSRSGIDHVVVVTMENRSFDHLLGWLPGADGKQAGLTYRDRLGRRFSTHPLAPDFQGCAHEGPDHTYSSLRVAYNGGGCDGWLRTRENDRYAIGYYRRRDLPFFGPAAPAWTVCENYFPATMGGTWANRVYMLSGRTDRTTSVPVPTSLPTVLDRLRDRGISVRYYKQNLPVLAMWGARYVPIMRPYPVFLRDCAARSLPAVSFVDPKFTVPRLVYGNDDHPPADIRAGESFLNEVYEAVTSSPLWPRTLLVITFDEGGGFFDHVPPTRGPDVDAKYALRGFRVPTLLISPFARRGHVDHTLYDHASILKLIEWRFGLRPLAPRDRHANNLATALDFSRRDLHAPRFAVPRVDDGPRC